MSAEIPTRSAFRQSLVDQALNLAELEDQGTGHNDITSESIIPHDKVASGYLNCKQAAVIAGLAVFGEVLRRYDPQIEIEYLENDGAQIDESLLPKPLAKFIGNARAILKGERLALNLLQKMSGVATITSEFVRLARPLGIAIRDTRKTTPGLRVFEREAVAIAGGQNHRFGLFDAVLIKDNHIEVAGGIAQAIEQVKKNLPDKPIQVEAASLEQVQLAVAHEVNSILLDNMSPNMVQEAIAIVNKRAFIEVSGGINLANISGYLIKGVDAISVGALTHSAKNIDISLEVEITKK